MNAHVHNLKPQLQQGIEQLGLVAGESLTEALLGLLAELLRWNKAYNLTSVRDPYEMLTRHIFDSLSVDNYIKSETVLDVGTGAGFPGIPLALLNPHSSFVLMDSNGKKIRFIEHAVRTLGLQNVLPLQARVESHPDDVAFETIVCRAYSSLKAFVTTSGHLLASGGEMVAMKGRVPEEELAELPEGWELCRVDPVEVPGLEGQRHIVVLKREKAH
ncbi:MAG: 16S rRNA (guanine(527)-N(7))-methyltransferase RsmG [Gammaproteobacteria bacterium]